MLELVRGYATASLDVARRSDRTGEVAANLNDVSRLLVSSDALRLVVTDPSIASGERSAVVDDLLSGKVSAEALGMLTFAVLSERAGDLPKTVEQLVELAETEAERVRAGQPLTADTPVGRSGTLERIRGYAEHDFEALAGPDEVDRVEDELFRLARILEAQPELREALSDFDVPLPGRLDLLDGLLASKVEPTTLRLAGYALRAGRLRDVTGALDYLVDLAAFERGRRVAEVRAVVELSDDERDRLAAALGRLVRRPVEIRVVIDPSIIGGIGVQVGDTVIDGTVRHRLERLRDSLLQPA